MDQHAPNTIDMNAASPGTSSTSTGRSLPNAVTALLVLGMAAIVLGPLLLPLGQQFNRKMRQSQAERYVLLNKKEEFQAIAEELVEADPSLHFWAASLYSELNDNEQALAHLQKANDISPFSRENKELLCDIYLRMGKFTEAVAAAKDAESAAILLGPAEQAKSLNQRAYVMALGNLDLNEALKHINTAIELDTNRAAYLDTRGFVLYQLGRTLQMQGDNENAKQRFQDSVQDLQIAVEQFQQEYHDNTKELDQFAAKGADPLVVERQKRLNTKALAVLVYHRALVFQALERSAEAEADLNHVRELGFTPDEKLF